MIADRCLRLSGELPNIVVEGGQFGDVPSSSIALTLFGDTQLEIGLCRAHDLVQIILESIIGVECLYIYIYISYLVYVF